MSTRILFLLASLVTATLAPTSVLGQVSPGTPEHTECLDHAGDAIRCLRFCGVCGHCICSPDCPTRRPAEQPAPFSMDCSGAKDAVEEAERIDLDRQVREQAAQQQPYLRDWSKPGADPEGDYWHLNGNDPRRRTLGQQLTEIGQAIKSALGLEEGEVPDIDSEPPMNIALRGPLLWLQAVMEVIHTAVGIFGEIGIQRDRDYDQALLAAESDIQEQIDELGAQADRFESLEQACGDLGQAEKDLLKNAVHDIRARLAVLQARLDAIRTSLDRVRMRLKKYEERSPPESNDTPDCYHPGNPT